MKKLSIYILCFVLAAIGVEALTGCSLFSKPSGDLLPHLIDETHVESNPVRPIDSLTSTRGFTATRLQSQYDELLDIVYRGDGGGSKPDFTDALPEVKEIYDAAVAVLNRYILNSFSQFERVHAIHDYLAYYIEYDTALGSLASVPSDHPSFGLEGVFKNKKAVCDGFAKAFLLMCGIEGIRAIRITGEYNNGVSSENHAWNKVYIDGSWYNLDATMDSWHVRGSKTKYDIMSHGYFLVSDDLMRGELTGRHRESGNDKVNYECKNTYGFYKITNLGIGDYPMEITSQDELNDVFAAVKKSKRKIGKLELKLNFDGYEKSNLERMDAYVTQIREAYSKVSDADFVLNPDTYTYPYQRYPDGVFVFLIYK